MGTLQSRLDADFLLSHMCSVKFKEWIVVLATLLRRSEVCLASVYMTEIWDYAEKSRVGLWGQSLILEVDKTDFLGLKKGYLWRVLTNKDVEWSVTVWSIVVGKPSRSPKSEAL